MTAKKPSVETVPNEQIIAAIRLGNVTAGEIADYVFKDRGKVHGSRWSETARAVDRGLQKAKKMALVRYSPKLRIWIVRDK